MDDSASVTVSMFTHREEGAYLLDVGPAPDWTSAVCAGVDAELWFPGPHGQGAFQAKQICQSCPIREACLQYANDNEIQDGIWGGLAYTDRLNVKFGRTA